MEKSVSTRRGEKGFTLVELAIVMIIIGLLITGILKGQEMIANAQVTSTVAGIKGLDAATSTFRDTYRALPGDMTNVAARLPAICQTTCAVNGDGNGHLGTGAATVDPGAAVAANEGLPFFMQLAAVDLISGVNASPTAGINVTDEVPETPISNTSFRVGYIAGGVPTGNQGGAANTWRTGHYLAVTGDPVVAVGAAGTSGLTPIQATRIDSKLDDGNPQAGIVRAGGAATCVNAGPPVVYNGAVATADCSVFIRIQG